jgi:hypothetical protein
VQELQQGQSEALRRVLQRAVYIGQADGQHTAVIADGAIWLLDNARITYVNLAYRC